MTQAEGQKMRATRGRAAGMGLWVAMVAAGVVSLAAAGDIPAVLPDPDGQGGDATKPVKVYILAGQSNMVGMGELGGAKNMYTGLYLTSDSAVPKGPLEIYRVGKYKMAPLAVYGPDGSKTDQPVAQGQVELAEKGVYRAGCGFGESSFCVMELDGKVVYRRAAGGEPVFRDVTLEAGRRYAFKISGFAGEPPRFWLQKTDLLGHGDLEAVARREGKFPWLLDGKGQWTVRKDVYFQEARIAKEGKGSPLSPTSNGKTIGPELGFGHVMGTFHDEHVLLIKSAMGNRSLGFDFRPPSSGRTQPDNKWESLEYSLMVQGVRKTLDAIDKVVPGYKGQGYEMAGFVWWQGHKDGGSPQAEYEKHLVHLIQDVRKEFKAPKMRVVIATVGFGGHRMAEKYVEILKAQMAVADPKKHPEFAGTVASVDIRNFWREVDESPRNQDYHYNRNAETYMLVGDALGRAMVALLGGKAEPLPLADRPRPAPTKTSAASPQPDEAAAQAARAALRPIVLGGIARSYSTDRRYSEALAREAAGQRPKRASQFLRGAMYGLVNCYRSAGIHDYDWHTVGPDMKNGSWEYFSFDPPEQKDKAKGERYRKVTFPAGMETWFAPDFDAGKAGWKTGPAPFGQLKGEKVPLGRCPDESACRCGVTPGTLWEKEVLLLRKTIEAPKLKAGHRYRIVVGGSNHVNAGEGFALYVNGTRIMESNRGVGKRQGGQARGGHLYKEFLPLFQGRNVTLAVMSFLRYNHPRTEVYPRGHISVWLEEQKIPPMAEVAAGKE